LTGFAVAKVVSFGGKKQMQFCYFVVDQIVRRVIDSDLEGGNS
jgi:hypothetical protein